MSKKNSTPVLTPYMSPLAAWAFAIGTSLGWGSLVVTSNTYLVAAGPAGTTLGLVIGALIMLVMEKNRDIAILKSMGATTGAIMRIFLYQGLVIGVTGMILGVFGGLGLCGILSRYKIIELPANVYPMSTIPIKVVPADVTLIAVSALAITLLATLYPSRKAAQVQPAEALSYE